MRFRVMPAQETTGADLARISDPVHESRAPEVERIAPANGRSRTLDRF
jgi:hypothetical protein